MASPLKSSSETAFAFNYRQTAASLRSGPKPEVKTTQNILLVVVLTYALFDLGVGWPRQTYFELRQRPIQRGKHDVVSPVRFGRVPHPSRTALFYMPPAP